MQKLNILLIKPKWFDSTGVYSQYKYLKMSSINLGIIAACSGDNNITVIDEDWSEIDFDKKYDIAGITVTTFSAGRAYFLAERLKKNGTKVVFGGVHVSLCPDEFLAHCDSIVIGEAENTWPELLKDVKNGILKKKYISEEPVDLKKAVLPRRDLLSDRNFACLEVSRGCVNNCNFCYLPDMPWKKYRHKDVDTIKAELDQIKSKTIFIIDDNMFVKRDFVFEFCNTIKQYYKKWSIQVPVETGIDFKMIKKMAQSGLYHVFMGFQTIDAKNLSENNIVHNKLTYYRRAVRNYHRYGVSVCGFFIFGFDNDKKTVFDETVKLIKDIELDDAFLYILSPYPGTKIYNSLKENGRLLKNINSHDFGWQKAVFKPVNMTPEELEYGTKHAREELKEYFKKRKRLFYGVKS